MAHVVTAVLVYAFCLRRLPPGQDNKYAHGVNDTKHTFDPEAHAADQERSREQDERDLASGAKTREQLRRENGAFAFPNAVLHLDRVQRLS